MPAVLAEPAGEQLLPVAGNAATRYRNHTVPLLTHLFYRYRWEIGSIASCSSLKAWKPLSSTAIFQLAVVGGTAVLCCAVGSRRTSLPAWAVQTCIQPPAAASANGAFALSDSSQWQKSRSGVWEFHQTGVAGPLVKPCSFHRGHLAVLMCQQCLFFLHTPKRIKSPIMRDKDFFRDLSHYSLHGCSMLPNMKVFDEAAVCQNGASKSRECTEREHT